MLRLNPIFLFAAIVCGGSFAERPAHAAEDGKRTVDVPRYGVRTRVPQAWNLIDWGTDDRAFELQLPQDRGSKVGHVRCTLSIAPASLEDVQSRARVAIVDPNAKPKVTRKLRVDEIAALASPAWPEELVKKFARRLVIEWECEDSEGRRWFERSVHVIGDGMMYVFSIDSDEAHYDAFSLDFTDMCAELKIKTPDNKLQPLETGHWLQRDFRFGFKLPEKWRPVFSLNARVLFLATGTAHGTFNDALTVHASLPQPLNLEQLKLDIPEQVKKRDAAATVECRIVEQGNIKILETLVRSKRRDLEITTLERRFQTRTRNYDVKLSCATEEFQRREAEFRAVLDSFIELPPKDLTGNAT
ncbi:MAG: hypothetical protein K8U03_11860 [Planctomycetia bacterium]|nr:hypothetical protein [Planctomycetia bacterium]